MWRSELERLEPVDAPQANVGAPLPHILASDNALLFVYFTQSSNRSFADMDLRGATSDDEEVCAVITVSRYQAMRFGPPNDEAINGHQLYKLGLRPYSAFEVKNSSWIAELEIANRVHSRHRVEPYLAMRHFIFTFHDTTLEFVGAGFSAEVKRGSVRNLLVDELANR